MGISINRALENDAKELLKVQKKAFYHIIEKYGHFDRNPYDMSEKRMLFNIHYQHGKYYKIIDDDTIIGGIFIFELESLHEMKIAQLYLLPEYQGKGIGTKALEYLWHHNKTVQKWIVDTIYQETDRMNFYQKNGFKVLEIEEDENIAFATLIRNS